MMNEKPYVEKVTGYWMFFAKANFILAVIAIAISVWLLEVTMVTKGYFILASLYLFTTTVLLSKTVRDDEESKKILNRIDEAKTTKILKDFDKD